MGKTRTSPKVLQVRVIQQLKTKLKFLNTNLKITTARRNEIPALLEDLKTSSVLSGDVPQDVQANVLAEDVPIFAGVTDVAGSGAIDAAQGDPGDMVVDPETVHVPDDDVPSHVPGSVPESSAT